MSEEIIQKVKMLFATTVFSILNSVKFVTPTFTKTEALTISLMFVMNGILLLSILSNWEKSKL